MEIKEFIIVQVDFTNKKDLIEPFKEIAVSKYSCMGVEDFSIDEPTVDEILGERAYSGGDVPKEVVDEVEKVANQQTDDFNIKFYFYGDNLVENVGGFIREVEKNENLSYEKIKEEFQDWNDEWRKHYKPIEVSKGLRVVPEWFKEDGYKDRNDEIYIYPGMGFGTGEHETTYLCLKHLYNIREELSENTDCLDFGCGSGILGIGAIKLKNMYVEFCDIDPAALDNCVQNLELNFVEERLNGHRLVIRDRFRPKKYELVFANILEHVLILEKDEILESLKSGSFLILSGILNEQVENILSEYSMLEKVDVLSKGDWSSILMRKK